jgi:hypothetical protein
MANEITMGYLSGHTLTYGVYQPDGTVRTAAGTPLPEIGTTGYYTATDANITAGDFVIVKEGATVVGQGQYKPEINSTDIDADFTEIKGKIDQIIQDQAIVTNIYDETVQKPALIQVN